MKNFRKVLALILVVATLFSFVAMASAKSASEYTDYADVKYVEAVDVLTALGIINGYDGAYHPADTIDRDEMAKMIAVLRNGGDFDADLYVTGNKFADVKGQWAEGYIAYCAQLGIIAGRNATTFDPDAAVKVVEVAKQLLCVLGFDAQKQGYVGANWEVAVIRDATKYGLIPAEVDPYAAATRDQAAQMFLNALECDLVAGYLSENVVYITNSLYGTLPYNADDGVLLRDISLQQAEKDGWEVAYGNAVVSTTPLYTIYANLNRAAGFDCYGRPGTVWTLTDSLNKVVFQKFYAATPISATNTTTATALEISVNSLKKSLKIASAEIYIDGVQVKGWDNVAQKMGYGAEVETYKVAYDKDKNVNTPDETVIRVVVKNTYIAEVGTINKTYGTFTLINEDDQVVGKFALTDTAIEEGDMVLYYLCNGGLNHASKNTCKGHGDPTANRACTDILHDVTVVEPVVAAVTYGRNVPGKLENSYFIAGGTTYAYNWNHGNAYEVEPTAIWADGVIVNPANPTATYDIYLDANGKVMYWELTDTTPDYKYAYVVEGKTGSTNVGTLIGQTGGAATTADYFADLVNYTGTATPLTVSEKATVSARLWEHMRARSASDNFVELNNAKAGLGTLIKYYINAKGEFVYGVADENGAYQIVEDRDYAKFAPAGMRLVKGSHIVLDKNGEANGLYLDNNTKIMIRTNNGDGTYSYTETVGYQSLTQTYIAEAVKIAGGTQATNIQYFTNAKNSNYLTYVFIDAKYTVDAANTFMLVNKLNYHAFDVRVYGYDFAALYTSFDAIVNGVESVVLVPNAIADKVELGILYSDVISLMGAAFPEDGNVPLYVQAKATAPTNKGEVVKIADIWNDGVQTFLPVYDAEKGFVDRVMAENCALWTITFEDRTDDDIINPIVTKTPGIAGLTDIEGTPNWAYVTINPTTKQVTAVYRLMGTWQTETKADGEAETFLPSELY